MKLTSRIGPSSYLRQVKTPFVRNPRPRASLSQIRDRAAELLKQKQLPELEKLVGKRIEFVLVNRVFCSSIRCVEIDARFSDFAIDVFIEPFIYDREERIDKILLKKDGSFVLGAKLGENWLPLQGFRVID